jgi:hypothetical protein
MGACPPSTNRVVRVDVDRGDAFRAIIGILQAHQSSSHVTSVPRDGDGRKGQLSLPFCRAGPHLKGASSADLWVGDQ